jgi:hypothetical protein
MNDFTKFDTTRGVLSALFLLRRGREFSRTELSNGMKALDIGTSSQQASLKVLHESERAQPDPNQEVVWARLNTLVNN